MCNETDIRLINAHAKRNRGGHDNSRLSHESMQIFLTDLDGKSCVIRQRSKTVRLQPLGIFMGANWLIW
jgi:hypothetical protein